MTRHDTGTDLDPVIAAELEALEAALADAPGADPALVALVRDVRADAPSMPLALRERLDGQMAAGFPRERRRFAVPTWAAGHVPLVAGSAAAVLVALVVGVSALGGGSSDQPAGVAPTAADQAVTRSQGTMSAAPVSPSAESAPSTGATGSAAAPSIAKTAAPGRKVERAVDLSLSVGADGLANAADGVVRTTQQVGGFVQTSQIDARPGGGSASFVLRVPTARLDVAVAQLSKLGHVAALSQSAQDITGQFNAAAARLADARRERAALLRALGRATAPTQIAALRARIAGNRDDIARLSAEVASVRRRADLSTVNVDVQARKAAVTPGGGGSWTPGDAAGDALRLLQVVAGVLIVSAAALVPLAALVLLGVLVARLMRRRRREHALDGA